MGEFAIILVCIYFQQDRSRQSRGSCFKSREEKGMGVKFLDRPFGDSSSYFAIPWSELIDFSHDL